MQNNHTRLLLTSILGFLCFALQVKAEGSKQLSPTATDLVNTNLGATLGRYDGTDVQRLYIHIKDAANEQVFLGFSQPRTNLAYPCTTGNATAYFRIKNAAGTVVYPTSGNANGALITANITGWATASAGPSQIVGASGYTATVFNPATFGNGDYYIEFSKTQGAYNSTAFALEWWDITVATKGVTPAALNGRVFTKNWALQTPAINCAAGGFTCGVADAFGTFDRPFNGAFHVYSPVDSVVTKVNFLNSGLRPVAFNIFFNDRGPGNSGTVTTDRKSVSGLSGTALYPLFLNDPDLVDYPNGTTGTFTTEPFYVSCDGLTGQFFVNVTKAGQVDLLIDLDKTSGAFKYDPGTRDVAIALKVVPALGEVSPYKRAISWNGKDGLGAQVNLNLPLDYAINYAQGVFHLPIYDAEFLTTGFTFNSVRPIPPPAATAINMYYDDSNIVAANLNTNPKVQLNGCVAPCHKWNNACYGDVMTINTWFFGSEESKKKTAVLPICLVDAVNDAATVTTPSITLSVLSNDSGVALDSASISTAGQTAPLHGSVTVNTVARTITYTPTVGYFGKDSFRYKICDINNYTCDSAWVVLTMPSVGGFTFNCGTATTTGTFTANGTAGQAGTLVVPMTGATAGTVTLNVSGTGFTGTLTTTLTAGQTSVTIPITYDGTGVSGSRTLTVTSTAGVGTCSKAVTVVCPTIAAATATIVQPTCAVATGTITVTAPSSGVTYSFDNGTTYQASATSNALVAGTYSIITKTTTSTCLSTAVSKTITAQPTPAPLPTTSVVQPTCSVATGTITVTSPASGVTYSFDNGVTYQASATSGALAAGTYQVIVKNITGGCTSTAVATTVNAQPSTPSVPVTSVTQPTCATATGTITVTSPASGVTYSFDNGVTYQASATSGALAAGTYQVIVKNSTGGCTSTAVATMVNAQPSTPSVPVTSVTQPTCATATGTITVTSPASGATYSFDNGVTYQASATSSALVAGTYQVIVKNNAGGCISTAIATTVNTQPVTPSIPVTSVTQPTCASATGIITVTSPASGVTYSFDNGVSYQASATSGALAAGTYQVIVKNSTGGCTSTAVATTVDAQPAVPAIPTTTVVQPTCSVATGKITVTTPTSGVTYSFDNGASYQATSNLSGLASGTYQVMVKNTTSTCTSTAVATTVNAQPVTPSVPTISVAQPSCATATGTITVTSPASGVTYSFNNGVSYQATATSSALTAGTYQIIVKNTSSNCTTAAVPTTVNTQPVTPSAPVTSVVQPTCFVATGTITVITPTSGVTFSFDNGTTYQASATSNALTAATYQVVVKDDVTGCATSAVATTVNPQPTTPSVPTVSVTQPICSEGTGTITIMTPTGAGMTYSIDDVDYSNTSGIFNLVIPNTYNITAKTASGCISPSASATINPIVSTPVLSLTQPTCLTSTGGSVVTSPTGAGYSYSIDGVDYSNTTGSFTNLAVGNYSITVRNASNCVSAGAAFTINPPVLTPIVSLIQPTCSVATGTITVTTPSTGVTYSFDNGVTYQASPTLSALPTGVYSIIAKDDTYGCLSATTSATINTQPVTPSAPVASVAQPTCFVATGTITVTSPSTGVTYSFNNGLTYQASAISSALTTGVYSVVVKDNTSNCATAAVPTTINAQPTTPSVPTATATQPTCASATGTITVTNPSSGVTYSFDNGTTYQAAATSTALTVGTHQVVVKSIASSCASMSTPMMIDPQPAVPIAPTTTVVQPTCSVATGTITVTSPSSGVIYSFDNGVTFQASPTSDPLAAGMYQVFAKDNMSGCASAATTATINAQPVTPSLPTTSVAQPTCSVSTGIITVTSPSSGVTYSFNNGATYQASAISSALSSGVHQVVVKDNTSNCATTAVATTINAQPVTPSVPVASVTEPTCSVATGTITVTSPSSGVTYSFDNGTTYQASEISSALPSGVYQVVVKGDVSNCATTAVSTTINAQPATPSVPVASVTEPTCLVATGTITVTSPSSGVTYSFDNGTTYQAAATSTALSSGVYQVVVKGNVSNCATTAVPTTINAQPSTPSVPTTTVTDPTCSVATGTITVTNPSSGVTYSFDNGATYQATATSSSLATGVHQVVVKSNVGACASAAQPTTINAQPTVPSTPTTVVTEPTCSVATGIITVTSPASGVTYSFDNGTTYQVSNVSSALTAATYQVIVKDDVSDCASAVVATIVNPQPVPPSAPLLSIVQPTCAVATGTITVTSPSSGVTYSFDNGVTYQVSATLGALIAGNYDIKAKETVGGCESSVTTATINASASPPPVPTTTVAEPTCTVATGTITVTSPSSGATYSFDNGVTYQATATSTALIAGIYQVVIKDDLTACASAANPTTISAQPVTPTTPTATVTQPVCAVLTGTITITSPSSGVSYSFDNGATYQPSATASGLASAAYGLIVKDDVSNCASNMVTKIVNAPPSVPSAPVTSVTQPTCSVATGTITVTSPSSGVTYSFDNGTTYQASATSNSLASATYQVLAKDNTSGCESVATATTIDPQPVTPTTPAFTYVAANCANNTGSITVTTPLSAGFTYSVNGSDYSNTTGSFTGLSIGLHIVSVKSSGGCLSPSVPVTFTPWMSFDVKVILEGTYQTATGLMQTTLNQRGLLPGQTPIGQFAIPTPQGQPFKVAPWNYAGTEGDTITTYPATVVDWVLLSLRTDSTSSTNVFRAAGWLHKDGHVSFITPCFNIADGSYFVLIEHRNHVGVLSSTKVTAINSLITQDFTTNDSYIRVNPPSTGQKLKGTKWVMLSGDGKKDTPTTNYDVNFNDAQLWKLQSGIFDQYLYGDFNMDADINFSDSFLWKLNSGKYSGVPHW